MNYSKKNNKKEPAPWKPIDLEKFNKNTKVISKVFKSDPERISENHNSNHGDDKNIEK